MKPNSIVKITGTTEDGEKIRHVGRLIEQTETTTTIRTLEGTMSFITADHEVKNGRSRDLPKNFDEIIAEREAKEASASTDDGASTESKGTKPTTTRTKKERKAKSEGPTKMERAMEIVTSYKEQHGEDMPRKDALEAFQKDLAMSKAGASTYFHSIRKKLNEESEAA